MARDPNGGLKTIQARGKTWTVRYVYQSSGCEPMVVVKAPNGGLLGKSGDEWPLPKGYQVKPETV